MTTRPRVVFAGTPEFAVPSLQSLLEDGWPVAGVLTQPDRPAGRGRRLLPSPVKRAALAAGLPVLQPVGLRDAASRAAVAALAPDLLVVAAYGLLLPQALLDLPRAGCINVHASLLPRWRGAAPIQRAILAGDRETGISIMRMVRALDAGPVYLTRALAIGEDETAGELHDRLARLGGEALLAALTGILAGTLAAQPQPDAGVTYASKLEKDEAVLDWSQPAVALARRVRAFNPWPVAETRLDGARVRIWRARVLNHDEQASPGTLRVDGGRRVRAATGEGWLELLELQWPGKRVLAAAEALAGRHLDGRRCQ
ncbi:MAG: methionyl-tRNA formyltransferase [Gammaproteobacteria bacterium]|nr:methionyl-tRNA formyltransferase [Gammaproteobacteria bacterium]TVQ48701.1 MAG: methionyl-tRNA formyltransferase [Gammaproteobacteria bacterium]